MADPFEPEEAYEVEEPILARKPTAPIAPGGTEEFPAAGKGKAPASSLFDDLADEPVAERAKGSPAPAYLPRLWKGEPEPGAEPAPTATPAAKPDGKKSKRRSGGDAEVRKSQPESKPKARAKSRKRPAAEPESKVDGDTPGKVAETPKLDTYESRQRARLLIGGVLGAAGVVGIVMTVRAFRGNGVEQIPDAPEPQPTVVTDHRAGLEVEARNLIENARRADKAGRKEAAVDLLNKVAKDYQGTPSAKIAMEALDRDRRKLTLFGTDQPPDLHPTAPRPPEVKKEVAVGPQPTAAGAGLATETGPVAPKGAVGPTSTGGDPTRGDPALANFKALPSGFRIEPGAPIHASGWPTRIICNRDKAVLVLVPGGVFLMGREDGEPPERPAHRVMVSTFYIDQHEVTVGQFAQFLKDTGTPSGGWSQKGDAPNLPAIGLSARQAWAYCNWAGRRLPTEAQWEMAARAPNGRVTFGDGAEVPKSPAKTARPIEPVMTDSIDLAACGAFDLGGNAAEWTSDYYESMYYQAVRDGAVDPRNTARVRPEQVAVRGGSKLGILTHREGVKIESRLPHLGFRGALPVEGESSKPPSATNPAKNDPAPNGGNIPF